MLPKKSTEALTRQWRFDIIPSATESARMIPGNTAYGDSWKSMALPVGLDLGHYRILSKLGQGGFGITYLALNQHTGEQVVIKENLPTFYAVRDQATWSIMPLDVEDAVENYTHTLTRFVDEARLLARLRHPNIVRVSEAFEALGTAYYVMPYISGQELHKAASAVVTEAWLLPIVRALLNTLAYLHSQNLLHRDLKPGNILLQPDGSPILIDFGTARALYSERSATMVGTPGYTPIEQVTTRGNCGAWTDLYALGATCYRVITGEMPPDASARLADDVDPYCPLASRADLLARFSPHLLRSIDKALAVRAKNRWQRAEEWLQALQLPPIPQSPQLPPVPQAVQLPPIPLFSRASLGKAKNPLDIAPPVLHKRPVGKPVVLTVARRSGGTAKAKLPKIPGSVARKPESEA